MYCICNPTCIFCLVNKGQTSVKSNKVKKKYIYKYIYNNFQVSKIRIHFIFILAQILLDSKLNWIFTCQKIICDFYISTEFLCECWKLEKSGFQIVQYLSMSKARWSSIQVMSRKNGQSQVFKWLEKGQPKFYGVCYLNKILFAAMIKIAE